MRIQTCRDNGRPKPFRVEGSTQRNRKIKKRTVHEEYSGTGWAPQLDATREVRCCILPKMMNVRGGNGPAFVSASSCLLDPLLLQLYMLVRTHFMLMPWRLLHPSCRSQTISSSLPSCLHAVRKRKYTSFLSRLLGFVSVEKRGYGRESCLP